MEVNELRIGNLIHFPFHKEDVEVVGLPVLGNLKQGIQVKTQGTILCEELKEQFQYIPLSEKRMIKFGFKEHLPIAGNDGHWDKYWGGHPIEGIAVTPSKQLFNLWDDLNSDWDGAKVGLLNYGVHADIFYVHQLQNLYFALTGEELTIEKL